MSTDLSRDCAVCGRRQDPNETQEFSVTPGGAMVCFECGERYSAELLSGLEAARTAYIEDMRDSGER